MIHAATENDLSEIVSLWEAISLHEFSAYIGHENVKYFIESGELSRESKRYLDCTYVCKRRDCFLGYVVVIGDLIELLVVMPEYQNAMTGKRLYDHALKLIRQRHRKVRVECFSNNQRANSILKRLGYDFDGSYQDDIGFMTNKYSKRLV
ncbi:GNAT family N-acetyltransferase [Poriferisphaera sp. WC338]|uniref:GNAT family N-acetyltransferase n=1 Tax=Poriferisphaera sp. WC338 TaxID=3425129 RepID=UPI003D813E67